MTPPRFASPTPPDVAGSYGAQAVRWGRDVLGVSCYPWQSYALGRALEHRSDGSLRWPTVLLTVSRQSGKSHAAKIALGWRVTDGAEVFGESQLVLNTASKGEQASELWSEPTRILEGRYDGSRKLGKGSEHLTLPDGSRWITNAATLNLGVSLSVSMALVDEAWNVKRSFVESGLMPTMLERESPQIWLVSTAGDSGSDLLEAYRREAIDGLEDPAAEVLILEWSASPAAAIDDRQAWRDASPHWTERREKFLARQVKVVPENRFRMQYLNQRVQAAGGWVTRELWRGCQLEQLEPEAGAPMVAAIEYAEDATRFGLVVTTKNSDGRIVVRSESVRTSDELWQAIDALPAGLLLYSPAFKGKLPTLHRPVQMVGMAELRASTRFCFAAIERAQLAHDGDATLAEHVLSAVAAYTDAGPVLSQRRSPAPITLARAMVWAIGAQLEAAKPAPRVFSIGERRTA